MKGELMAAWSDCEGWADFPALATPVVERVAVYTAVLPTPCPRCNQATIGECPCCPEVEEFPTEVWAFFDDEALAQLVKDASDELCRRFS